MNLECHVNLRPSMKKLVQVPLPGDANSICDQIADGIVDEYLRRDPKSRLRIQVMGAHGMMMIGGCADSKADFDATEVVHKIYNGIGYDDDLEPFVNIERFSEEQSKTMVRGGASESVIVTGYATKETRELLPKAQVYTYELAQKIYRSKEKLHWLRHDGSVQVVYEGEDPISVALSLQHKPGVDKALIQQEALDTFINPFFGTRSGGQSFINTMETFVDGGFSCQPGISGSLASTHSYAGLIPIGTVSIAGKDPYSPSRAGMYMARHVAKVLVREGVAPNMLVRVAYTEGKAKPVHIEATSGSGEDFSKLVADRFDFQTESIVEELCLAVPIYQTTQTFGWFGNDALPWEA